MGYHNLLNDEDHKNRSGRKKKELSGNFIPSMATMMMLQDGNHSMDQQMY
jgi:hypothetical protein